MAVPASTQRMPAGSGTYATHLATLTLRSLLGRLLVPVSSQMIEEEFGANVTQAFMIRADWPAGSTEDLPIEAGDLVTVTASGKSYSVFGVRPYPGDSLEIYVEVVSA